MSGSSLSALSRYRRALSFPLFFAFLALLGSSLAARERSASPLWREDLQKGLEEAKKEDRPLLLYFSSPGCIWCERLEELFLEKSAFRELEEEFVLVKILFSRQNPTALQKELKRRYKISSFPTMTLLGAKGEVLANLGYPRDTLPEYIAKIRALAGIRMVPEKKVVEEK